MKTTLMKWTLAAAAFVVLSGCVKGDFFKEPADASTSTSSSIESNGQLPPVVVLDQNGKLVEGGDFSGAERRAPMISDLPPYDFKPPPPRPKPIATETSAG